MTTVWNNASNALDSDSSADPLGDARAVLQNAGFIQVVSSQFPSAWDPNDVSKGSDVGMALLAQAPGVTPKPYNTADISGLAGDTIRLLGYGVSNASTGSGTGQLRQISIASGAVSGGIIATGNGTSKGTCLGDSGGPSYFTFPDGVERLVGIHSVHRRRHVLEWR